MDNDSLKHAQRNPFGMEKLKLKVKLKLKGLSGLINWHHSPVGEFNP
jgi:hypothetical protein